MYLASNIEHPEAVQLLLGYQANKHAELWRPDTTAHSITGHAP